MIDNIKDLDNHKLDFHLEELLAWKNGLDTYPIHLDIGPSGGCVNRCVHCYLKWYGYKSDLLSKKVMDNIIEDGKELNLKSIFLAGSGEPLMNPYTPDFIVKANKNGVDMAMATNGLLLDETKSSKIMPYLNWIRFNVLAYSEEKFSMLHGCDKKNRDIVFDNIKKFIKIREELNSDTGTGIGTCILPEAINEIDQLIKFAKDSGLDYISIRPVSVNKKNEFVVNNKELYQKYSEQFESYVEKYSNNNFNVIIRKNLFLDSSIAKSIYKNCYGVNFINQIDANGDVIACGCFVGNKKYIFGNLNNEPYKKIFMSEQRKEVLRYVESIPDIEDCDDFCRCHNINKYLWRHKNPPRDVNFI